MSNELAGVTNKTLRDCIGTYSNGGGVLAIDGSNVENIQTTGAVVHYVNGVRMTDLATIAEWDLSAAVVIGARDGEVLGATFAHPAIATADDGGLSQTIVYVFACRGDVPYIIEETLDVAAAQDDEIYRLTCPNNFAPFGAITIIQVPTAGVGVAAFQLGVDDLNSITGRTTAFFNLSHCPESVAEMVVV